MADVYSEGYGSAAALALFSVDILIIYGLAAYGGRQAA
jgi:hypothetical protein